MYSITKLTMPKAPKVTTVFNGKRVVWEDCEEVQDYFIRQMMTAEEAEYDRYSAIYIQLIHGLNYCTD